MIFSNTFLKAIEAYKPWLKAQVANLDKDASSMTPQEQITLRHRLALGGTAVSSISGANPYQSALDIYNIMAENGPPPIANYKMRRGLVMEELVAQRAAEILHMDLFYPKESTYYPDQNLNKVNYQVQPQDVVRHQCVGDFVLDIGFSFLSAQYDCFVSYPDDDLLTIIECKTTARNTTKKDGTRLWGLPLEVNENGIILNDDGTHDTIPAYYVDQVQWQLLLLNIMEEKGLTPFNFNTDFAYVAVDIGGSQDVSLYKIKANEERQIELLESAAYFMLNNVMTKEPPMDFSAINPPSAGSELDVYQADCTFTDALHDFNEIKKSIRDLSAQADEIKNELEKSLGAFETGAIVDKEGKLLARKTKIIQSRFDSKALANDDPDTYLKYKRDSEYFRVDYY